MKQKLLLIITIFLSICFTKAQNDISPLKNPITTEYLQKNIKKSLPRLVYTKKIVKKVKSKLKKDPVLQNLYTAIKLNANNIYTQPTLKREIIGRRMLDVSRELLYRINILGFIYLMEEDEKALQRINNELVAVCNFTNWNAKHFLDVGEMALGVALALDWTQGNLPKSTITLTKKALIEKALKITWLKNKKTWGISKIHTNWNQVCQGGLIAAAIAIADDDPELAAKTIHRALDGLPNGLKAYAPDGAYPEGSTYWQYATSYSVTTIEMFKSAFCTDFGHYDTPGFKESALFRSLSNSHSDLIYNYFDCRPTRNKNGDIILAWFAMKSGIDNFFERERFLLPLKDMDKLSRFSGIAMSWISAYKEKSNIEIPTVWKGDGVNPIAIFKSRKTDKHKYFLGCKGGKAGLSHGNMDAGSFVFDLNGVRWSLDIAQQDYHKIEKTGFNLWSNGQNADRWKLLSKNNYGHSTITINNEKFKSNAFAPLIDFKENDQPKVSFDLTSMYGENIKKTIRSFIKDSPSSLLIEDTLETSEKTKTITWQMITTANISINKTGAILSKNGKKLKLENLSHPDFPVTIISLYPAPLELDSQIKGLKRIEIQIPAEKIKTGNTTLKIRLSEL
ncbi:hypothetical protein A8C32_16040 [Flavivirga aquatica]|uniref:Heparinase II/III-like C-terminal domain-containing protein n=1 Tax=Flavivirga aquatica TaxID=1849968 RepID=A0A1E5T9C5_9FLAO|nr:heparinase II/III family protein [Flavivirga aquatica]OEK07971.1 hypothetical protein A8C32_16040 [Flavivirga aquatica]